MTDNNANNNTPIRQTPQSSHSVWAITHGDREVRYRAIDVPVRVGMAFNTNRSAKSCGSNCALLNNVITLAEARIYDSFQQPGYFWVADTPNPRNYSRAEIWGWLSGHDDRPCKTRVESRRVRLEIAPDMQRKGEDLNHLRNLDILHNPITLAELIPPGGRFPDISLMDRPLVGGGSENLLLSEVQTPAEIGQAILSRNSNVLLNHMRDLAKLTTTLQGDGNFRNMTLRFVEHFAAGTGNEFSDSELDSTITRASAMQEYISAFESALHSSIRRNSGVIGEVISHPTLNRKVVGRGRITRNPDVDFQNALDLLQRPQFRGINEILRTGTFFLMHDTHCLSVDILDYIFCNICRGYRGRLRFNIYDHFGLDQNDVESRAGHLPRGHWAVFAWYALQHYNRFPNTRYNPFISKATVMSDISGGGQ